MRKILNFDDDFARAQSIKTAVLIVIGGTDKGSKLVVGPEQGRSKPISPMEHILEDVHEIAVTGTIFPDKDHNPVLHMHIASGRKQSTITGCVRKGVRVWHVMEVILFELVDTSASRVADIQTGFELVKP